MSYVIIFCISFSVNFFYAMYVKYLSQEKMIRAAIFGECIVVAGAINIISYVNNHWLLIPAVIGGFIGTLLTNKISAFLKIN
jgi:hypothetical protein